MTPFIFCSSQLSYFSFPPSFSALLETRRIRYSCADARVERRPSGCCRRHRHCNAHVGSDLPSSLSRPRSLRTSVASAQLDSIGRCLRGRLCGRGGAQHCALRPSFFCIHFHDIEFNIRNNRFDSRSIQFTNDDMQISQHNSKCRV